MLVKLTFSRASMPGHNHGSRWDHPQDQQKASSHGNSATAALAMAATCSVWLAHMDGRQGQLAGQQPGQHVTTSRVLQAEANVTFRVALLMMWLLKRIGQVTVMGSVRWMRAS